MLQHVIWSAGLAGHVALVAVLVSGGRARRFPLFTSLIFFEIVRTLALSYVVGHLAHHAFSTAVLGLDAAEIFLEFATLSELVLSVLAPLDRFRRSSLALLLLVSGVAVVLRLAPVRHYTIHDAPLLLHFLLAVLFLEWTILLALLLRPMRLNWRSGAAAISLGFGVYSAALIFAGAYFSVGREMRDFIFFSYLRIGIYLTVLLWWILSLSILSYRKKQTASG